MSHEEPLPTAPPSSAPDSLAKGELRALVGPTAAGKSDLAMAVAERAGAQIVSLDSMLVYRGMDIGTAKPDAAMLARVPHHMLDLVEPDVRYDVQRFLADLRPVLDELQQSGQRYFFVGGTAFYLKVLTHGLFEGPAADMALRKQLEEEAAAIGFEAQHSRLRDVDPISAERLHPNDSRRVVRALEVYEQTGRPLSAWQQEWRDSAGERLAGCDRRLVGVGHETPNLDLRIRARAGHMIDAGWPEEACAIRSGSGFGETAIQALGYAEVLRLADGELDRETCEKEIALRTRQFARKQRTWYRKFEEIKWLERESQDQLELTLKAFGWS